MVKSPRERFQENAVESNVHAERCVDRGFLQAMDAALLQYIRDLPNSKDAHSSIINSARIEGAEDVLKMLLTIADKAPLRPVMPSSNLPGNIRDK